MKNYEDYKCSTCGVTGMKLWRDYGYCDELWCATCCERIIAEKGCKTDPFDEPPGPLDMMRSGFSGVAAIPTDGDCDSYQSAGALKAEQLLWWHALPTFKDEDREIRTVMHVLRESRDDLGREERACQKLDQELNNMRFSLGRKMSVVEPIHEGGWGYRRELADAKRVMLETLRLLYAAQGRRMELIEEKWNLEWILSRTVVEAIDPFEVTIWGTKVETHDLENGRVLRISKGEEQPFEVKRGQRIAVSTRGHAVVLLSDNFKECPSIMDFGQDGNALLEKLRNNRKVLTVRSY